MPKPLLALALVMTQLLSWSVPPVYLCLESDGSICIDSGPEHCDCCRSDRCWHDHFSADGCCTDGDDCQSVEHDWGLDAGCRGDRAPCNCTHIQISQQQSPIVLSPVASPESSHVAAMVVASLGCLNSVSADLDAPFARGGQSSSGPWPQSGRLSVVLRC